MKILAIDLGKFNSVACPYDTQTQERWFEALRTTPSAAHDLVVAVARRLLMLRLRLSNQAASVADTSTQKSLIIFLITY